MADYASNVPVSKPTLIQVREDKAMGGMSWSDEIGLYYKTTDEMSPIRPPIDHSGVTRR